MENVTNERSAWELLVTANASIIPMAIERYDKKTGKKISKDYAEVNQRVKAFRYAHPLGFINSHVVSNEAGVCVFRAEVGYYNVNGVPVVLGTGTACEKESSSQINQTSYIENCETSAVGRALGMAGYGIDTSICSAEELQNALLQQEKQPSESSAVDEERYRALALKVYGREVLDNRCMELWKTDFKSTPLSEMIKVLPLKTLEKAASKR